jgi:hypothetical protein
MVELILRAQRWFEIVGDEDEDLPGDAEALAPFLAATKGGQNVK